MGVEGTLFNLAFEDRSLGLDGELEQVGAEEVLVEPAAGAGEVAARGEAAEPAVLDSEAPHSAGGQQCYGDSDGEHGGPAAEGETGEGGSGAAETSARPPVAPPDPESRSACHQQGRDHGQRVEHAEQDTEGGEEAEGPHCRKRRQCEREEGDGGGYRGLDDRRRHLVKRLAHELAVGVVAAGRVGAKVEVALEDVDLVGGANGGEDDGSTAVVR